MRKVTPFTKNTPKLSSFFLAMSRKCVLFGLISLIIHNKAECSPQTNSLSSVSCFRARDKKHKLDLKYCIVAWQQD